MVPRRRARRAPAARLHPVERGDDRAPRAAPRRSASAGTSRRTPRRASLYEVGLQPLLPRQEPPRRRRPHLLPGARLARYVRARVPGGPADRAPARRVPPGAVAPGRRPAVVPAPAPDAGLLGVPDGLDGPRRPERDLPGAVQPLPAPPGHQGHLAAASLGLPRRRRDGRAGDPGRDRPGRARGAGQPHLRDQLQPAAPRRPGPRQRQGHAGAGGVLPGRRLERHQGRLGPRVGPAAGRRHRRRAGQPDELDARRRLPDLQGGVRRVRARALLRPRPAHPQDGRAHVRRRDLGSQARRPRLPQALRGLQGGHRAHRPADGHPRQDHQGLDAGLALRGPQRHAPDEEADAGRPEGLPRPALPRHPGLGAGGQPVRAALLPPGHEERRDRVPDGAARGAGRLDAARATPATHAGCCPRTRSTPT